MRERESVARGGFVRKNGVLLLTGIAAVGLFLFASSGASSHHHDTGMLQLASACRGHGEDGGCGQGGKCVQDSVNKDASAGAGKYCPLITESSGARKCPVKALIGNKVVCPVMGGKPFTVTDDTIAVEHGGRIYFLCCPPCEGRFKADPEAYTGRQKKTGGHEGNRHNH